MERRLHMVGTWLIATCNLQLVRVVESAFAYVSHLAMVEELMPDRVQIDDELMFFTDKRKKMQCSYLNQS